MKNLKIFVVIVLITFAFIACKKVNVNSNTFDVTKSFQAKVVTALKSTKMFSNDEINLLKSSVVTFEDKFRGFNNHASLLDRLNVNERQAFYEQVTGASLTIFNSTGKILINGKQTNPSVDPYKKKEWKDMAPVSRNDCSNHYDATCVTY